MRKLKGISYRILILIIFFVGTLAFSGSVSATELAYDDGLCNGVYPQIHETQKLRERFLLSDFGLSGNYLVEKVRIFWGSSSQDFAGEIKLVDPNGVWVKSFVNPPQNAWQDYDVSGLGFISHDFYVELWQTSGFGYICLDTDLPNHGMSEVDSGTGTWYVWSGSMDFMIRVDVRERPLGALPVSQCMNLVELLNPGTGETEMISARVTNDFDGCIIEDSVTFHRSSNCTGDPILCPGGNGNLIPCPWEDPASGFVYKSGTRGGCAEAVEVTKGSPVCVDLTLKSGRKTHVCY